MFLKLMGPENQPDRDPEKTFQLVADVKRVAFERSGDRKPIAWVRLSDGLEATFELKGNAYVLDDDGKTIETFVLVPP